MDELCWYHRDGIPSDDIAVNPESSFSKTDEKTYVEMIIEKMNQLTKEIKDIRDKVEEIKSLFGIMSV